MLDILFPLSQQFLERQYRPYLRYFIKEHSFKHRLTIIRGQRGVGKSTVLIQLLRQLDLPAHKILYVPVDHFLVKNFTLYEIAQAFEQQGGEYLGFDEIHQYPNWSQEIKSIYDSFPSLHVFASGSSALAIHRGSHDLSRRAIVYTMFGMSFREYIEFTRGINLPVCSFEQILSSHVQFAKDTINTLKNLKILELFNEYLRYGYYPYSQEFEDKTLFFSTVEQNLHAILESDLPAIYPHLSGASVNKMKRLLGFLSTHVPFTVDLKQLKNILEISDERTLKQYMKIMQDAGVISLLHRHNKKLDGLKKADKIYPDNACQVYALSPAIPVDKGTLREVFFISMLKTQFEITLPSMGDFLIDQTVTFEIGGKDKDHQQIKGLPQAYLALDDIEIGYQAKIPLWLFGFLY